MDAKIAGPNTRQKILDLRAQAAETVVEAAKVLCKIRHHEAVAARLIVRHFGLLEEAGKLTERGRHFYEMMKEHQATMARQQELKTTLGPEIVRKRDKAVKLATQASAKESRASAIEGKVKDVLAEADALRRERDKLMVQVRKLEADAVRLESAY